MTETNGAKPTFDFSRVSHRDSKAMGRLQLRLQRLMAKMNDAELLDEDEFEASMDKLTALITETEQFIANALVDVPRDWLVTGAPDNLNWNDAESLNWVQSHRMDQLREALIEARRPESVAKNSVPASS